MKELAQACREAGLGFGFYYSHNQDWTAPGGSGGPATNPDGSKATFEQYFREKCFPQVKEICTQYGPLNFIWFDTPGNMPKEFVVELADYVRKTQPNALLCSRVGHGMGDYESKGDMEVPPRNIEGLWETCDTTNDSWSYAWYDQNWKDSKEILHRLVSTVGRGGTYLLNIGPDGKGRVPEQAAKYLRKAGEWIKRYPQVVYAAGPSPWGHALPWGDVTTQGNTLNLVVFDWPGDGRLWLPGLQTEIDAAGVVCAGKLLPVTVDQAGHVDRAAASRRRAGPSGIGGRGETEVGRQGRTDAGLCPNMPVRPAGGVRRGPGRGEEAHQLDGKIRRMEVRHAGRQVDSRKAGSPGRSTSAEAGDYHIDLTYRSEGRRPGPSRPTKA